VNLLKQRTFVRSFLPSQFLPCCSCFITYMPVKGIHVLRAIRSAVKYLVFSENVQVKCDVTCFGQGDDIHTCKQNDNISAPSIQLHY
jgi:hypothetical protein